MTIGAYRIGAIYNLLHVELDPDFEINLDCMVALWNDVRTACAMHTLRHVLVEGDRPARAMDDDDAVRHGELVATLHASPLRVALCLYDYEADAVTERFLRRANDGRISVQVFADVSQALRWLGA